MKIPTKSELACLRENATDMCGETHQTTVDLVDVITILKAALRDLGADYDALLANYNYARQSDGWDPEERDASADRALQLLVETK